MRGPHWLTLFGAVLVSWIALYAMSAPPELRDASRVFGSEFWVDLCTVKPDLAGFGRLALMWILMSTAMMLPTAVPALAVYDDIGHAGARTDFTALAAGFLAVWAGFSLVAAGLQMALSRQGLLSDFGDSRSTWLSATLLAAAGAYQFSALKAACLSKCRTPIAFFLQHWDDGAFRLGLRLGASCLGCCWALMLLAFVGGVMSLAFMGAATFIMIIEKLPEIGRWVSRPLGIGLLCGAGWMLQTGL